MNERQCTGATAWTCRQPVLWQGPYVPHDVTEASGEVSPTGVQVVIPVQSFVPGVVALPGT